MPYKDLLSQHLKINEGVSDTPYTDQKGNPTVGVGMNLNDPDVRGLLKMRGIEPEEVTLGTRKLDDEESSQIHDSIVSNKEKALRSNIGSDLFESLKPNEQAAIMSMGYQSQNNIGPNLKGYLANSDKINAIKEMVLNTNKDNDPGIALRRLREGELFGGPVDFSSTFKIMSNEEKRKLMDTINSIGNENTKAEALKRYSSYLQDKPQMNKIQEMLNQNYTKK